MLPLVNVLLLVALAIVTGGCKPSGFSEAEKKTIASLSLAALPPIPADPTNKAVGNTTAMALGATLFFDLRLSRDGTVACSTCHQIGSQFQDSLPRAQGLATTNRRTMPLAGVAWSPWMFWDGRRDSLWAQALTPLEDAREHGGNRAGYAHFIADNFRDRYERIFGPMPDLSHVSAAASPLGNPAEKAAWAAMPEADRDAVNRVFADMGKMIAAFERSLVPKETRFDRFAAALAAGKKPNPDAKLTDDEIAGLELFIGKGQCVRCHNGPRFTDDHFHNTGVPAVTGLPEDLGRETAVAQVAADPFNCLGKYSDAGPQACGELRFMVTDPAVLRRAYKTPSLRGVATRPPYMHAGQFETLEAVLDHYSKGAPSPSGHNEVEPLKLGNDNRKALIAFLKTLTE